jgi:hypothetical protein
VATVSDTDRLRATDREPRLALTLALECTVAGLPSVAELASLTGVVTTVFELADRWCAARRGTHSVDRRAPHRAAIVVLAVVEHDGVPLIITGDDGALRSWRPDGTLGEFAVDDAHLGATWALAVVEHDGAPLIVTAGRDGALRRWRLDGTPGELAVDRAHLGEILALAVVEHDGAPLIISAGEYGALRSWRLDGSPGELADGLTEIWHFCSDAGASPRSPRRPNTRSDRPTLPLVTASLAAPRLATNSRHCAHTRGQVCRC